MTQKQTSETLQQFVETLEIGEAIGHQNLTLVPLRGEGRERLDYILGADAIEAGTLTITEVDESGSVPELLAVNETDQMILLLDGEELVGLVSLANSPQASATTSTTQTMPSIPVLMGLPFRQVPEPTLPIWLSTHDDRRSSRALYPVSGVRQGYLRWYRCRPQVDKTAVPHEAYAESVRHSFPVSVNGLSLAAWEFRPDSRMCYLELQRIGEQRAGAAGEDAAAQP